MSLSMTPELASKAMRALDAKKAEAAKKYKITVDRLMRKLDEELEAHETKVFNDKESGIVYSEPLIAWKIRQEARRDAEAHLGIKPADKQEVEHSGNIIFEIVDYGDKGKAKRKGGNGSR